MKIFIHGTAIFFALLSPLALSQNSETIRLYVFDHGELQASPSSYNLTEDEVATTKLALSSFLIVHPDGNFLWDAGAVMDTERMGGAGTEQIVVREDGAERPVTLGPPMLEQMAAAGYSPEDITHLALSHYHWDHTANANLFAHAKFLVRPEEHEIMFAELPPGGDISRRETYSDLRNSETIIITEDEYDVFGDGKIILKAAPGHTPGHLVLYVDLQETGGVVLTGDLYHYQEEYTLDRYPVFEHDLEQTRLSREVLNEFLQRTQAELWIQHDLIRHQSLRKAPEFYW